MAIQLPPPDDPNFLTELIRVLTEKLSELENRIEKLESPPGMKDKLYLVYMLHWKCGYRYIGVTHDLTKRMYKHRAYNSKHYTFNSSQPGINHMKLIWQIYGEPEVEIIENHITPENKSKREAFWIEQNRGDKCLNLFCKGQKKLVQHWLTENGKRILDSIYWRSFVDPTPSKRWNGSHVTASDANFY